MQTEQGVRPFGKYFDELELGEKFRSRGRTITEADIVNWCGSTGDMYILHTDAEYSRHTRFGQRIAPGFMVHAFMVGLVVDSSSPTVIANYGTGPMRFVAPVFIGDTIHLETEVVEKRERPDGKSGLINVQMLAFKQDGTQAVSSSLMAVMAISQFGTSGT